MSTETLIYSIIAGIIALGLALFQYIYKSKKRSKVYILLTFLRCITIFSVLLLLINPKFDQITFYEEKPNLVIAIDNSESVAFLNQDENVKQFIERLTGNSDLNAHFNIEFYTFGREVKASDSLTFNERQSNMALVFDRLSEVYNNTTSPTIILTDGNQTYGNDYEFVSSRYKQPVFPVILGDTIQFADLKIQQLNVNRYAYLKNKFPVEIIAVYNGSNVINTQLKITSGTAVLHSQNLSFNPTNASQVITVNLPANRVGTRGYKAELIPLTNEKNKVNNYKNFAVDIIDQKTNVAIVSEVSHPDLGAIKNAIESNEQRKASIVSCNEFISNSRDYQLAIIYQPNNNFRGVYREIETLKMNKFVILGTNTNWSVVNSLQSNYNQEISNQEENFQPILNRNYGTFIIDDLSFDDLPPLSSEFGALKFSVPIETILFKSINGIQIEEPLLATFEINNRREAVLNGEGIWKWRAQSYLENKSFNNFDDFIGKLVQYLSTNTKRSRLNVDFESIYESNVDVRINAQYFNKNYEFDNSEALTINLKNKDSDQTIRFPFVLKNSNYSVDLSGLRSGEYDFIVTSENGSISKSGTLKISDYNVEQQFLNANVTKLEALATNSNGTRYFIDNTDALSAQLLNDTNFATIQKSSKNVVPLIDWKYLLALIAFCLSAEWFIRKFNGLI
ncbi:hypothetical protein A9Q87_09250 [Flavobacteriales bacterium 34_180_T64]|nr:hypothetical protein A9Q87_09250 [Flavobacteriales bacterium 34_180_T64]